MACSALTSVIQVAPPGLLDYTSSRKRPSMKPLDVPTAISVSELANAAQAGSLTQLIDVRAKAALDSSAHMIAGAKWRNPEEINAWLAELDISLPVIVYCVHGRQVSQGCA